MREYQPAAIKYHRPTNSSIEVFQPIRFGRLDSCSLEKSIEMNRRD